ncbi:hypothetical protein ACFZAU_12850 [Streptomyces sp. NPDC008238]
MDDGVHLRARGAEAAAARLSEHCELAKRPEHEELHRQCRRLDDHPLPGHPGILVTPRCRCSCHREGPR